MKLYVQLHWNGSADQKWNPQNKQRTNANYFTELFRAQKKQKVETMCEFTWLSSSMRVWERNFWAAAFGLNTSSVHLEVNMENIVCDFNLIL